MHDINLEQYKVFYYVSKNMSFSKAAHELFISQSAVSQSIKNLETRLNVKLFARETRKIDLTAEGKILFDNISIAFSYFSQAEKDITSYGINKKNRISIAASDTISKYYLLDYINKFHTKYPDVKIKITNKPSNMCLDLLKDGKVDIALSNNFEVTPESIMQHTKVKIVKDVFIAGPKYAHLKGKQLSLFDLSKLPILTLEKSTTSRTNFDELMHNYNLKISPEIEMQSMGLLKDFTRIGLGIAYINNLAVSKSSDLFVLDIKEPLAEGAISAVTIKRKKLSEHAEYFLNLLKFS